MNIQISLFEEMPNSMKRCPQCGNTLEQNEFWPIKTGRQRGQCQGYCKKCAVSNHKKYIEDNVDKRKRYMNEWRHRIRYKVLCHYCDDGIPKCACCGEKHNEFLSIDHIYGGGNQHKKSRAIKNIYHWLYKNKFPEGYRVLCHNCNQSLGTYGYCPHRH